MSRLNKGSIESSMVILAQQNDYGHFSWSFWFQNNKSTHEVAFFFCVSSRFVEFLISCLLIPSLQSTLFFHFSCRYPFPTVFSTCSKKDLAASLEKGVGMCLYNMPEVKVLYGGQKCGNGYVEEGEECDCGELEVKSANAFILTCSSGVDLSPAL